MPPAPVPPVVLDSQREVDSTGMTLTGAVLAASLVVFAGLVLAALIIASTLRG